MRSANQILDSLISHKRCLVPASKIDNEWAHKRDYDVSYDVICRAIKILWEDEILARSENRKRRPSLNELDKLFKQMGANKRQKLPVVLTSVFAIFSCRRLGEICRLRWKDIRISKCMILVRNMKHPSKKKTNNVWGKLPPEVRRHCGAFGARSARWAPRRHVGRKSYAAISGPSGPNSPTRQGKRSRQSRGEKSGHFAIAGAPGRGCGAAVNGDGGGLAARGVNVGQRSACGDRLQLDPARIDRVRRSFSEKSFLMLLICTQN